MLKMYQVPDGSVEEIEKIVVLGEKANRTLKDSTSSISVLTADEINNTQYNQYLMHFQKSPT